MRFPLIAVTGTAFFVSDYRMSFWKWRQTATRQAHRAQKAKCGGIALFPRRCHKIVTRHSPLRQARMRVGGIRDNTVISAQVEKSLRQAALFDEVRDRLHDSALGLSGGQQQRLCIARALAVEPEVLLMDEPASALDPIATQKIEELVHELKQSYTIIIVTHSMQQAARVSDRTAFFYMGKLVEVDATETIFTRPAQKQTEDYITGRFG